MNERVLLVDDHPVVRRGYASIIDRNTDLTVCGEAASGREALEMIPEMNPDLVVTDISMEEMSGIELIKHIGSLDRSIPVLVISVHSEMLYAERALHAGAAGYVVKDDVDDAIIEAIRTVLNGGIYVSEPMNAELLRRSLGRRNGDSPLEKLSDRELEVFEHIGKGLSTREIADNMFISPKTVGTHRRQIQEKLNISTVAKLQQHAVLWTHRQELGVKVKE